MNQSTFAHTTHTRRVRREFRAGAWFVRCAAWLSVVVLATACSGEGGPAAAALWDEARWDVTRWVDTSAGATPGIAAGRDLDAAPLRLRLSSFESDVGTLRELVIDVRRTQVAVRDRVAALEAWALGPSVHGSAAIGDDRDVHLLEAVADAGLEAGAIASSTSLNSVFAVLASDLFNIHEFMGLLELDSNVIAVRLAAVEDAVDAVPPVIDDPSTFDVVAPVVAHVFVSEAVMRADEMNENLGQVAVTTDLLDAADEMMSRLVDVFLVRIVALEDLVGGAP